MRERRGTRWKNRVREGSEGKRGNRVWEGGGRVEERDKEEQ